MGTIRTGSVGIELGENINLASEQRLFYNNVRMLTDQQPALTTQLTTLTCQAASSSDFDIGDGTYGAGSQDEWRTVVTCVTNLQTRLAELEARIKAHNLIA
jgi:hypothetical protein